MPISIVLTNFEDHASFLLSFSDYFLQLRSSVYTSSATSLFVLVFVGTSELHLSIHAYGHVLNIVIVASFFLWRVLK